MSTVLISGANRGLGLEFVRQYLQEPDTRVLAGARDPGAADALQALAGQHGERLKIAALDAGHPDGVRRFREAVGSEPIDVMIANAGVFGGPRQNTLDDLDYAAWLQVLQVNTLGPMRLAEAFLPNLKAGQQRKLVAISSTLSSTSAPGGNMFFYRSAKAALNSVWSNLAVALKRDGITCTLLHPGWVKTDMGGENADIETPASIEGMRKVISGLTSADSGRFLSYEGASLPW